MEVVWFGVVWFGVVWCGVVWCGVVWFGLVWCGVVWCFVMFVCGVVLYGCLVAQRGAPARPHGSEGSSKGNIIVYIHLFTHMII